MEDRVRKVASRNRATLSCGECHRRRKKCSQGQPCRNCARRYPPVECVYSNPKRTSPTSEAASVHSPDDTNSNDGFAGPSGMLPMGASSPAINQTFANTPSSLELTSLPRRDFHSVIWAESKPLFQEDNEEEYNFNSSPQSISQRPQLANGFPADSQRQDPDIRDPNYPILPPSLGCGTLDLLPKLSVDATKYNAELFYIYNQVLLPRVWSIDGRDECPRAFYDAWIPFTTFSPVILHANLLRASVWRESMKNASVLRIENHAPITKDAPETLNLRLKAVNLLNSRLRNGQVDDECVTSVAFFFFNEWSFSDSYGLQGIEPHVRGLREMLRLRGGLHTLGANGYIAKLVMMCHYHLATVLEREAFIVPSELLQDGFIPDYIIEDSAFDSPLFMSSGTFTNKTQVGELLPATSQMLDQMTWIISQIIGFCYERNPDFDWSRHLIFTINIRDWIESLPTASHPNLNTTDDFVYECVRITSLIYCRAIISKLSFSLACRQEDFEGLFTAMSRVSLSRWKQLSGVWCWILLALNPRARNLQDGIQLRSLMKICAFALAQREWQLLVNVMEAFMALQRWIRETGDSSGVPVTSAMLLDQVESITSLLG